MHVFEVIFALLSLRDSLHLYRIDLVVTPFLQCLYERRNYVNQGLMAPQLLRLFKLFDTDPALVSFMTSHRGKWDLWLTDYAMKDKEVMERVEMVRAGMFEDAHIDWPAALDAAAAAAAALPSVAVEEDTETEEALSASAVLVGSDGYIISSGENIMGVD